MLLDWIFETVYLEYIFLYRGINHAMLRLLSSIKTRFYSIPRHLISETVTDSPNFRPATPLESAFDMLCKKVQIRVTKSQKTARYYSRHYSFETLRP